MVNRAELLGWALAHLQLHFRLFLQNCWPDSLPTSWDILPGGTKPVTPPQPPCRSTAAPVCCATGTDSDWSRPGQDLTGYRTRSGPHNMGTVVPGFAGAAPVLSPLSPQPDRATPGHDVVSAGPDHVRQVVFRERSPSNGGEYRSAQASNESWHGSLR